MKKNSQWSLEELEQFDNSSGDFEALQDIPKAYREGIGYFFIVFSSLEHTTNLIVADMISDRAHDTGYRIISTLTMNNKIDFLSKILLSFIKNTGQKREGELKKIKQKFMEANTFRNYLAHANWTTLKLNGLVRTKIITDNDDGQIKFKYVKITPKIISKELKEADDLIQELESFVIDIHNAVI